MAPHTGQRRADLATALPLRVLIFAAAVGLGSACGLDKVGPNLDAWAAAEAARKDAGGKAGLDAAPDNKGDELKSGVDAATDSAAELVADADDEAPPHEDAPPEEATAEVGVDAGPQCVNDIDCVSTDKCMLGRCKAGQCGLEPMVCPDQSACKLSTCKDGDCVVSPAPKGSACDDKDVCTKASACSDQGACLSADPSACDDANSCTLDECDAKTGCKSAPIIATKICDDGNLCTSLDQCDNGSCKGGSPKACPGVTDCTTATCDAATGACGTADNASGTACNVTNGGICLNKACILPWATAIAVGPKHACARLTTGALACWGANKDQQIGEAGVPDQITPTVTSFTATAGQFAVGDGFTCNHSPDKGVQCWGKNDHGQAGKAAGASSNGATSVAIDGTVVQMTAGDAHVCARATTTTPKVWCWGAGADGQLGKAGVVTDQFVPVQVSLDNPTWIAAGGGNTCALVGGVPYCWGGGGVLWADPKSNPKPGIPAPVKGVTGLKQVAVGSNHACGSSADDGHLVCWGTGNAVGQLAIDANGLGTQVADSKGFIVSGIAVGQEHTCVVSTGHVLCFGAFAKGQKGKLGGAGPESVITKKAFGSSAVAIGGDASCALRDDGSVQCWGPGADGKPIDVFTVPGSAAKPAP